MQNIFKKVIKENGQVAVIVAITIIALVGMLAYVIDVGSMYETRRNAQTAADSAALAGAQELPENPAKAKAKAIEYAQEHGNVTLVESDIHFSEDYDTIFVDNAQDSSTPLFFSGIFGLTQKTISAKAIAKVFSPRSLSNLVPWIVKKSSISYGHEVILKSNSKQTPGNFQAMDYNGGGGGSNEYKDNIINGYDGEIFLNEWYPIEAGNMAGPTGDGVETRLGSDICTLEDVTDVLEDGTLLVTNPSCPRIVLVPITNDFPANPSGTLQITGFAIFFINEIIVEKVNGKDQAEVTGQFIKHAIIPSSGEVQEYNGGIKVIRLID